MASEGSSSMANGNESPAPVGASEDARPRRERISQACEACRTQKARCRPSEVPGTCEKCLRTKKACVPHIPKLNASSVGKGKRRSLAKMESRIEALYQLLNKASPEDQKKFHEAETNTNTMEDTSDAESPQHTGVPSTSWYDQTLSEQRPLSSAVPSRDATTTAMALSDEWQARVSAGRPPLTPTVSSMGTESSLIPGHALAGKLVTTLGWPYLTHKENYFKIALILEPAMEELLTNFRLLLPNFPFVNLSADESSLDLVSRRPLLTAAMLVVASAYNKPLQATCDDLFKSAFALKAIVNGEKNLDILQALQVYVVWHQHYWNLATSHAPIYTNLAITIALELGFDAPFKSDITRAVPAEALNVHGLRAMLGCYYLSSLQTGLGYNKPLTLTWSSTLERCAAEVAAHGKLEHDKYMPAMVSLLHIAEDIKTCLRGPASRGPFTRSENTIFTSDNDIRTALSYSHLEQRLRAWDADFPTKDLTWLTPTRHFLSIYLFESALLPSNLVAVAEKSTSSQRQLDLLAACLSAARLFLDGVLASPTLILDAVNIGVWTHVLGAVLAVTRLSRPLPPDLAKYLYWDHVAARSAVNVSHYTNALVRRMRDQNANRPVSQQRAKLIEWFETVTSKIEETVFMPEEAQGETPDGALFDNVRHYAMKPQRANVDFGPLSAEDEAFWSGYMSLGWMGDLGI